MNHSVLSVLLVLFAGCSSPEKIQPAHWTKPGVTAEQAAADEAAARLEAQRQIPMPPFGLIPQTSAESERKRYVRDYMLSHGYTSSPSH